MKQRIFALIAILTGATAGTAVTAVNFHLRRKTSELEKEDRQNLDTASKLIERADLAQEQSFMLQRDIIDFAKLSDVDKEKVKALVRKLAREEKDGSDIPAAKQTEDEGTDCKSEEGNTSATPQATTEDEEEDEEKLMEEYWRRAKNIYGHGNLAHSFAENAKPVYQSHTGYAYISVADAAKKTGYPANYIRYCCNITDPMGKMFFSEEEKGGVFSYISQTEYARIPKDRIEVDLREQKTKEKKDDDIALTVTPQEEAENESVTPQASDNRRAADDQQATVEDKGEREKLVAEYLRRVESVFGQGKEARMMAASARPIRNTQTGYAYISITDAAKKTGLSARDIHSSCVSNGWQGGEWRYISQTEYAKMPKEKVEVETKDQKTEEEKDNNTTPVTPQATTEGEEEKLMAEFRRRAEKVYGRNDAMHGALEQAKPIRNSQTGYAYISISDAARKTGYSASYIHNCCKMKTREQLTKMLSSDKQKGGVFYYISQTEYAKTPEEMTEVETKNQKTEIEKLMEEYWRRAKNVYGCDKRSLAGVQLAKLVRNSRTGYAYISASDAAIKTDTDGAYIYQSCASNNSKADEWRYITKIEYAKLPEEMTEVETWDQRAKEETK